MITTERLVLRPFALKDLHDMLAYTNAQTVYCFLDMHIPDMEAAGGYLDYLFREKGARQIYAYTEDDNFPSQRLCEKLGMRKEGEFWEFVSFTNKPDGTPLYENTWQYAILKREWKGAPGGCCAKKILETERLWLRRLTCDDFDNLCRTLQDGQAMYAYEGAFTDAEVWEWLDRQLARYEKYGFGLWAVILKETG